MSINNPMQGQLVYQTQHDLIPALHKIRHDVHSICLSCMNKPVRVQTIDGHTYEGILVLIEPDSIHLQIQSSYPGPAMREDRGCLSCNSRGYYSPYGFGYNPYAAQQQIQTLSLFTLLSIFLLM